MGKDDNGMVETRTYPPGVPKIPTERVDASELAIYTNQVIQNGEVIHQGDAHFVHEGEWVEVIPVRSMTEYLSLAELVTADTITDSEGKADDKGQAVVLAGSLKALSETLAQRVVSWNWTDIMGIPLDKPYGRPDLIRSLATEELVWLIGAAQGETGENRGNASTPSRGTSSTARAKSPRPARAS
jgi:hypothetical protein